MRIKKKRSARILIAALAMTMFSLPPISALAYDGTSEIRISSEERRRIQETYGLGPPPEAPPAAIGDFGFRIGGLAGSFGGSDLSNPARLGPLTAQLGLWTFRPLPFAVRICVRVLNCSN